MEFWIKAAQLILSLSILVVLHEFGHYIPARLFKTRVEKFYLFFNYKFSLFKKKIGETEWGIGWIPLGGYVKIAGMIDESMDKEQMKQPAKPWEFRSKPAWQRLIIMTGGVIVNLILGMVIYVFILFAWGDEKMDLSKMEQGMAVHPYLEQYGVFSGDLITAINGEPVEHTGEVGRDILVRGGRELTVKQQNGITKVITLPEEIDYKAFSILGENPLVHLRHKNTTIDVIAVSEKVQNAPFRSQEVIHSVDGKKLTEIDTQDEAFRSAGHVVTFITSEGKKEKRKLSEKEFKLLLWVAPAFGAGLQKGDKLIKVGDRDVVYFDDLSSALFNNKGKHIALAVERNGEQVDLTARVTKDGKLGFLTTGENDYEDKDCLYHVDYGFGESWGAGITKGYWTLHDYVAQMKFIFTKKGAGSLGGFGAIGGLFAPEWDWHVFWERTALISIILAFMNILPIPALDGGHVVFLLYEMITGREAPEKVLEVAQYIGIVLILGLVLYANGNDLYRWLVGA